MISYDPQNIFARILRGELPCAKIYENDHVLAFQDIRPQTQHHILIIPKKNYVSFADFSKKASDQEMAGFIKAVGKIATDLGLDEDGYRLIANHGKNAHQEVPHFHVHLMGGQELGPMVSVKRKEI
ncbi:MAG: histidine triad nucleotide-binding protein [Alphaproteobacteria bacterium]|nr:histidine triad nucleotide-binding protein [Alphaproteobacteria bacterium]